MPIYEFRCPSCGKKTEKLCRMGETGESLSCADCNHQGLKKVFSLIQRTGRGASEGGSGCGSCSSTNCGSCH